MITHKKLAMTERAASTCQVGFKWSSSHIILTPTLRTCLVQASTTLATGSPVQGCCRPRCLRSEIMVQMYARAEVPSSRRSNARKPPWSLLGSSSNTQRLIPTFQVAVSELDPRVSSSTPILEEARAAMRRFVRVRLDIPRADRVEPRQVQRRLSGSLSGRSMCLAFVLPMQGYVLILLALGSVRISFGCLDIWK